MKRGFFIVLAIIVFVHTVTGQTLKTGVLVIGSDNNAVAAGIQASVSGVKTVLLLQQSEFDITSPDKNLSSGIELEFLKRMRTAKGIKDSTAAINIDHATANSVLKKWTDSTKNLTVIRNASWIKFKRSGNGWHIELRGGRTIKAEVLVNADRTGKVNAAVQIQNTPEQWQKFTYDNNLYRTSLASGYAINNATSNQLPLSQLFVPQQENLVVLSPLHQSMAAGQAAGATAAYAAFFKVKTSESNLKTIQGELINYKQTLIPFADVTNTDSNWKAIQFIGLSGFLKGEQENGRIYFRPDLKVSTAEIKKPVKEYYYKAQIWFDDHRDSAMTISSTLDLICTVGNKSPLNTLAEVKKKWKEGYHFNTEFDEKRQVSRREFAVLVSEYLKPFDVNIDKTGRVLR